jgi:hypothetical protein
MPALCPQASSAFGLSECSGDFFRTPSELSYRSRWHLTATGIAVDLSHDLVAKRVGAPRVKIEAIISTVDCLRGHLTLLKLE